MLLLIDDILAPVEKLMQLSGILAILFLFCFCYDCLLVSCFGLEVREGGHNTVSSVDRSGRTCVCSLTVVVVVRFDRPTGSWWRTKVRCWTTASEARAARLVGRGSAASVSP